MPRKATFSTVGNRNKKPVSANDTGDKLWATPGIATNVQNSVVVKTLKLQRIQVPDLKATQTAS